MEKSNYSDELFEKAIAARKALGGTWEDVVENFLRKKCDEAAELGFYKATFHENEVYEITFADVRTFAKKHGMKCGITGVGGSCYWISFVKKKKKSKKKAKKKRKPM